MQERSFFTTLKTLFKLLGKHRKLFLFGLVMGVVDAGCQSLLPMFFRYVLNSFETGITDYTSEIIVPCAIATTIVIFIFFPGAYFYHYWCTCSIAAFLRDLRIKLFTHVQSLSLDFFTRNKIGEVTSRLNGDINAIEMGFTRIMGLTWCIFVFLQSMIFIYFIDLKLSILLTSLLICITIPTKLFLPNIRSLSRSTRNATGEANAIMTEYIAINPLIKSFAREDFGIDKIKQVSEDVFKKTKKVLILQFAYGDIMQVFVRFISPILILLYGGYLVHQKQLMVGDMVAFWGYWMILNSLITNILDSFTNIFQSFTAADRVLDYLEEKPTVKDLPDAKVLQNPTGSLEFKNVSFNYPGSNEYVLQNFQLSIKPGKQVALVGSSGAGKSTVLQLLLRFYDTSEGEILIDGTNIKEFQSQSVRNNIGFVMQESIFFAGTIEENMMLSKPNATKIEIDEALRQANAYEFVYEFQEGMETLLGERGARLSGGQKQRLAIARVFLKNPPILIFDEATSALDSLSEKSVQEAMNRLIKNRTTITVAHRLSTIRNAEEIIVMKKGKVNSTGTHNHLVANSEIYRNLAAHQGLA